MSVDLFWTRPGTDGFLGPALWDRGFRLERAGKIPEGVENLRTLLVLTGGMILPNDLDPDGCMVQ